MPSFVTYESFPIGASVINDNERSQRYGYSGVVKGHESRSPVIQGGKSRKGIVVLYTHNPAGIKVDSFEQQYLCDVKQGIVVTEIKEALVFKLEKQINLISVKDIIIEAQILQLKLELEQMNKIIKPTAYLIDFGQAECAIDALQAKSDGCVGQDQLDKVGKFMVLGTASDDVFHKTRRIAEQKAEALAKQHPTHTMSVVQVMSDHTANQVIQSQVKRYD